MTPTDWFMLGFDSCIWMAALIGGIVMLGSSLAGRKTRREEQAKTAARLKWLEEQNRELTGRGA